MICQVNERICQYHGTLVNQFFSCIIVHVNPDKFYYVL
jgi:hypothetical protein